MSMGSLQRALQDAGQVPPGWVSRTLEPRVRAITRLFFESRRGLWARRFGRPKKGRSEPFAYVGLDFMVTEALEVLLIEANAPPQMRTKNAAWLVEHKAAMMQDMQLLVRSLHTHSASSRARRLRRI